jgi:sugar lactone lactonase YvrE
VSVRVETLTQFDAGTGGLSLDEHGNLYSGDFGAILGDQATMGRFVYRITPDGEVSRFASGFEGASGNRFGPDAALYQSNIRGNRISRIDSNTVARVENGVARTLAADSRFKCPNGLSFDQSDNLYMVNFYDGSLFRIDPDGAVDCLAEIPGANNGHLACVDDRLIVVARAAHQLYQVDLDGQVDLLAGSGRCGGRDGLATECEFSYPNAIAVSPDGGSLFINESAARQRDGMALTPTRLRRVRLNQTE